LASVLFPSSAELKARDRAFFKGLARALAGALIFALPMMMTMEMWQLGFYIDPWRLALLILLLVPLLAGLSRFAGFKPSASLRDDVIDAFVAVAVAVCVAAIVLALFAVLEPGMSLDEVIGKIAIQAVPGSIGAMLARSQLTARGDDDEPESHKHNPSYAGELCQMAIGALFLSLNVAPTDEVMAIAHQMAPWQEIALAGVSLLVMHGFVYAVDLRGQHRREEWDSFAGLFLRFTVVGYAISLIICLYLLWTFGRTAGMPLDAALSAAIVLGFPAAIGAAAARLIL
jgi:putative integral membrane protein (TIGR02587 family)